MARLGLPDRWAFRFVDGHGVPLGCWGMSSKALDELYASCDALLNVGGMTRLRNAQMAARFRVYVETDPVTNELELARGEPRTWSALAEHNFVVVTYGENYGAADCAVPLSGIKYAKTRQPVDLDLWPMAYDARARFFTTIANYRQEGRDVEYRGEVYRWSKHHEWEKFLDLPRRTSQEFELALKIDDEADAERLRSHGWRVVSPFRMSLDVFGDYPAYFRRSRAEFTVAKDQNVRLRSGWFSERDACYLACGKPVVAQDTAFTNVLRTGEGLFGFQTMNEALLAIDAINDDYERHCKAARAVAEEYFEARTVAARFLRDLGLA